MNIIKPKRNNICAVLYIDKISSSIDESILNLSNEMDVYVYINKSSRIFIYRYCSLLPITGYCSGKKSQSLGISEVLLSIHSLSQLSYYGIYIPTHSEEVDTNNDLKFITDMMLKGKLSSSVFKSNDLDSIDRIRIYKNKWYDSIPFMNKKSSLGSNSTKFSSSSMFILHSDLYKIHDTLSNNKYLCTFDSEGIDRLIPSAMNKCNVKHLNIDFKI